MTTATATAYEYRTGNTLPLYALKSRKAQKQRGFRAKSTYGHCIKDEVLIDACVGCGQCAAKCSLNNIEIRNGKPRYHFEELEN